MFGETLNFIFLSPHFPPNYYRFCLHLHYLGVKVLGLADEPYDRLNPDLKNTLAEYYKVNNMHDYDELLRAVGYLTHKHGKIDRIDSHNEYWLETEAKLRTDFNIPGMKVGDIARVKRKSLMKETFQKANIPVARGKVVQNITEARKLIKEIGFPIVAKPDVGVGAAKTYKIKNDEDLKSFFDQKPDIDYIFEEFISGTICTFDGLTDKEGNLVFYTSHEYSQGVMETVNNDELIYYYSLRDIPEDLIEIGRHTLNAFGVRERFFHFEFFRLEDQSLIALEVNMRPPGGLTTDMFNYANDIDIYGEWAHIIVHNKFTAKYTRPYHCGYVGRKYNRDYAHSHEQILDTLGDYLVHHEEISGVFSKALGDYGYLLRSPDLDVIKNSASFIHQLAGEGS
jgi:biotin carboxylase